LITAPPNIITNREHHSPLFFPDFFPILTVLYPPQVIPYGFHGMEGGIHGMSDGIHGISRWNPTIFRWIPWNGRWIPYLFQMDSIPFPGWSPYGIHHGIIILHLFHTIFRVDFIWIPYGMNKFYLY
jgi:hypothetical protein